MTDGRNDGRTAVCKEGPLDVTEVRDIREGRAEGTTDGRTEGRMEIRGSEGRQGKMSGRNDGRKDGKTDGNTWEKRGKNEK